MERRRHTRVDIELVCDMEVLRTGVQHQGRTRNMSRNGGLLEFIETRPDVVLGDEVRVRVELPELMFFDRRCMDCFGVVRRLEDDDPDVKRVAVQLERVQFASVPQMAVPLPEPDSREEWASVS